MIGASTRERPVTGVIRAGCWVSLALAMSGVSGNSSADEALDARVGKYLDAHRGDWHDLNVPYEDGRILHDIIVEHGFTRGFEIGTSTGHSTLWIAWAMSKTGGTVRTVEIDEHRYNEAREHIAAAGLDGYVEFVLGNAHDIVPAADGVYDFVFSDADKDWYVNYFDAMYPKLAAGACFVAHNVDERSSRSRGSWQARYLEHVRGIPDMETYLHPDARNGVAVTCKAGERR